MLDTRSGERRRECANEHRFWTVETVIVKDFRLWRDRDKHMLKLYQQGKSMKEIATHYGLKTHSEVSRALKRAEGLDAIDKRSEGQRRMWAKRRAI